MLLEVNRRGIAALGMRSLGGSGELVREGAVVVARGPRYAIRLPVAVTVSGIDSLSVLHQNIEVPRGFQPFSAVEMQTVREGCRLMPRVRNFRCEAGERQAILRQSWRGAKYGASFFLALNTRH